VLDLQSQKFQICKFFPVFKVQNGERILVILDVKFSSRRRFEWHNQFTMVAAESMVCSVIIIFLASFLEMDDEKLVVLNNVGCRSW